MNEANRKMDWNNGEGEERSDELKVVSYIGGIMLLLSLCSSRPSLLAPSHLSPNQVEDSESFPVYGASQSVFFLHGSDRSPY